jgi:hypothetical protein
VQDIEKILDSIKKQSVVVAKPVEPIFHICLNLTIETIEREVVEEEVDADDEEGRDEDEEGKVAPVDQKEINVGV